MHADAGYDIYVNSADGTILTIMLRYQLGWYNFLSAVKGTEEKDFIINHRCVLIISTSSNRDDCQIQISAYVREHTTCLANQLSRSNFDFTKLLATNS